MEKELQGKLVEILGGIQSAVGKASDFAVTQLPDIAQSYVMYGRARSTLLLLCSLAGLVAALYVMIQYVFRDKAKVRDIDVLAPMGIFTGIGAITSAVFFFSILPGTLLVWLAPKVWLLKELAEMVR